MKKATCRSGLFYTDCKVAFSFEKIPVSQRYILSHETFLTSLLKPKLKVD